ncbi:hypothetical protein ACF0H5_022893 [Mactra antiquata]
MAVGAVCFIRILLVLAGVEENPGPPSKVFTYRYQYLLIEVGTDVLRKFFDHKVGQDFKIFLDNHRAEKAQFKHLIVTKVLTPDQLKLLPPIDNSPSSDNFDISLLYCLLRNTCGLRVFNDQVWKNPQSTDTSVEACITRLKKARNDLQHSGSVFEDKTAIEDKWKELCDILNELSNHCAYGNLTQLIKRAENVDIDENLKERFDKALKDWDEMEKNIDHGLGELKRGQENMTQHIIQGFQSTSASLQEIQQRLEQTEPPLKKSRQNVDKSDIQQKLISIYEDNFSTLPLCPLINFESGHLLDLYEIPTMQVVDYHKVDKKKPDQSCTKHTEIKTCNDLFNNGEKDCKNVYLTGNAGIGKTSFCKFIASLWGKSKLGIQLENCQMQNYADYLNRFDFVFYVNLRDTDRIDIIAMVIDQLLYTESEDTWSNMYTAVEKILNNCVSLIILDGLDEWTPKPSNKQKYEIPERPKSATSVYFTACRPYKIENVRLSQTKLDRQILMAGLDEGAVKSYVKNLIHFVNDKYIEDKTSPDFMDAVKQINMSSMLHNPMITSLLFMIWTDRPLESMSKTLIYGNIMDMLFKLAIKREIPITPLASTELKLPESLSSLDHLKDCFPHIVKLGEFSYKLLFEHDMDMSSILYTREQLAVEPYCMSETETDFFCAIGIISKTQVVRRFGKQEYKLSFLHNSYLEFCAAMYVTTLEKSKGVDIFNKCATMDDVLKFKLFLPFYAGLSPDNLAALITRIYSLLSADIELGIINSIFYSDPYDINEPKLTVLTSLVLDCYTEASFQSEHSLPLEYFTFDGYCSKNVARLRELLRLLVLNCTKVKYLRLDTGVYYDEFDDITNLQVLHTICLDSRTYNEKINDLMIKNVSSLHTLGIECPFFELNITAELPVHSLEYLTSLSLVNLVLTQECFADTMFLIGGNTILKYLKLCNVRCDEDDNFCVTLESMHLVSLQLEQIDVMFSRKSLCLEYIALEPSSCAIANYYYRDIFYPFEELLQLKHLKLHMPFSVKDDDDDDVDNVEMSKFYTTIQHLPNIRKIELHSHDIPDDVNLLLHPDAKQVEIQLVDMTLDSTWLQSFVRSCTGKHSLITLVLKNCTIMQNDIAPELLYNPLGLERLGLLYADTYSESVKYVLNFVKPMPRVSIELDDIVESIIIKFH